MNNLKLRTRLGLGFGLVLLLACLMGYLACTEMTNTSEQAQRIALQYMPELREIVALERQMQELTLQIRTYSLSGDESAYQQSRESFVALQKVQDQLLQHAQKYPALGNLQMFSRDFPPLFATYQNLAEQSWQAIIETARMEALMEEKVGAMEASLHVLTSRLESDVVRVAYENIDGLPQALANLSAAQNILMICKEVRRQVARSRQHGNPKELADIAPLMQEGDKNIRDLQQNVLDTTTSAALTRMMEDASVYRQAFADMANTWKKQIDQGKERATVHRRLVDLMETISTGGVVGTGEIAHAAAANSIQAIQRMLLIVGLTLLAGLLISCILTLNITRAIKRGVTFATEVSQGNFTTTWDNNNRDEIGQLASSLNAAFKMVCAQMFWYENILNAVPFSVAVTDKDMNWTFVNTAGLKALGNKALKDIRWHHCSEKNTDICNTPQCGIECLRRGQSETRYTNKQGNTYRVVLSFLNNPEGEHIGQVEIAQDVTMEERLQQEARDAVARGRIETASSLEGVVVTVSSAMTQLSAQISQAERGAQDQAGRVASTATAMEEMNSTVLEVANSASHAADISNQTRAKASSGAEIMQQAVQLIQDVQQQSLALKSDMEMLTTHAQAINRIMNVISDIADQTNLLALNAAIEAARAGDAGRGFAVVADEVRKLAEKTMTSTTDVGTAIQSIQKSAEKSSAQVDTAVLHIEDVTSLIVKSGESLTEIVRMMDSTTDQVRAIATASEQQSCTSDEINRSLIEVNSIAAETSIAMREASQAIDSLVNQAQVLTNVITEMKKG